MVNLAVREGYRTAKKRLLGFENSVILVNVLKHRGMFVNSGQERALSSLTSYIDPTKTTCIMQNASSFNFMQCEGKQPVISCSKVLVIHNRNNMALNTLKHSSTITA